jgi:biopolymer transport protein ExbD/biopolymer transport protein TolR
MAEINVTPFTDVLLVLLIIFMILAALVTPPGFQKALGPPAGPNRPTPNQKKIDVVVSASGVIFVDGRRVVEAGLYRSFADDIARHGKHGVSLTADAKAPYRIIIRILDAARANGLEDVAFVTS